jgi:hypothetical protein
MKPLSDHLSSRPNTKGDARGKLPDELDLKFVEIPYEKHEPSQTERFLRDKKEKQIRNRENVSHTYFTVLGRKTQARSTKEGAGKRQGYSGPKCCS